MKEFFDRMKELLSYEELDTFIKEYDKPHYKGVRVNTLKCSVENFLNNTEGFDGSLKTPFCSDSFYIKDDNNFSGNHPLHHAGAVYFQEPSAMSAATLLSPEEGDFILDLCAAPGGKSTQLASALKGTGIIWSNEIVRNRANILLSNMERCGVKNAVISSTDPETLCSNLEGVFDKILVDAPCSGEGMFRRDPNAKNEWSVEHTLSCGVRQLKILESAKKTLKPGGELVYSTCTFSIDENERVVEKFLKENPDFILAENTEKFGRNGQNNIGTRIYPMDGGEGHFAVKLIKKGYDESGSYVNHSKAKLTEAKKIPGIVTEFLSDTFYNTEDYSRLVVSEDKVYALPENCPEIKGNHVIRAGVFVGTIKKNYFEPAHALFMSADLNNIKQVLNLSLDDERVEKFLKGEEIAVDESFKGYTAVAVSSVVTGFGKVSGGRLKNKYPKGLRLL